MNAADFSKLKSAAEPSPRSGDRTALRRYGVSRLTAEVCGAEVADLADLARQVEGQTITGWLRRNVADEPDRVALRRLEPDGSGLDEWTWAQVGDRSARLARAFGRLGLGRGDRALLFLRNRPEFHTVDLGVLLAGGTPLSIYNSSAPEQVGYLAAHSEARIAVVDDIGFLERLLKVRDELPDLRAIVVVDDPDGLAPPDVLRLADLLGDDPLDLDAAVAAVAAGRPGHGHLHLRHHRPAEGRDARPRQRGLAVRRLHGRVIMPDRRRRARVLPADGARAERMVTHYAWLWQRPRSPAARTRRRWAAYLAMVRPNSLFGPPRVWEKLRAGIEAAVAAGGPERVAGFAKALQVGRQVAELRAVDQPLPDALAAAWEQVDAAAFAPLRARIGLDQLSYAFSGAAPLPVDVLPLLPLDRAAVLGDLRDEREHRRHDLGPVPGAGRHGRPGVPGRGGAPARRRRGGLPRRHRLPRLPGRPRAHGRDLRRRRLAAHRRHRPASTTTATCPSWTARRS